jgi:NAD(P) transhydrogenase subunit alpha
VLISFLNPLGQPEVIEQLANRKVTTFSMELIPRTSRAQSMDALSSQAGVAGYKAVLIAAAAAPKFFPMLTTAAGTIKPAKVFVMGAGVAGLQAIATARRLGAVVEAFDIRPAVKEEVQSLGAKFVEVTLEEETVAAGGYAKEISEASKQRTQAVVTEHVKTADVVITTAQVPGKKAPLLVTEEMVQQMQPGLCDC